MNKRIAEAFANGKAFIPFLTCGDPSLEVTEQLIYAMEEAGADLIELGIPFSDPTAEGPVIQAANVRALSGGVTTDKIFDMVKRLRQNTKIPMVFMTYANVVFSYGTERFIQKAASLGMDGLILPDIPFEEKEEFDGLCKLYGLDLNSLIAPPAVRPPPTPPKKGAALPPYSKKRGTRLPIFFWKNSLSYFCFFSSSSLSSRSQTPSIY